MDLSNEKAWGSFGMQVASTDWTFVHAFFFHMYTKDQGNCTLSYHLFFLEVFGKNVVL